MKISKEDKEQAVRDLKDLVSEGDTIYGIVRSVSRSGMSRTIDFYIIRENLPVYLTGFMSTVLKRPRDKRGALKVQGCGMDMVFACVSEISVALFGVAYGLKHDTL